MRNRLWILSLTTIMAASAAAQTETNDSTIVRVGYSKGDVNAIAGAVDQVTEERMNKGLITSSVDALSGQAAGVQVTPGGNQEAMISAVRVRGTTSLNGGNDPLVIIDGVTADLAILSTIYPDAPAVGLSHGHREFHHPEGCLRDGTVRLARCCWCYRGGHEAWQGTAVPHLLRW